MKLALVAGGWTSAEPHCWLPTDRGYLCFDQQGVIPSLEEAQDYIREYDKLCSSGKERPMTVARRALENPVRIVLKTGARQEAKY